MVIHEENKHNSKLHRESKTSDTSIEETLQQLQECYIEIYLDKDTSADEVKVNFYELVQKALTDENTPDLLTAKKILAELDINNDYIPKLSEIIQVALYYCVSSAKTNIKNEPGLAWTYADSAKYWVGVLKGIMVGSEPSENILANAFDPVPLSAIAKIFSLHKDEEQNIKKWRSLASKASRNGLNKTRASAGKGSAESTFNPWLVGEWVIPNLGFTQELVNRKLANNLPERSKDMKDYILL